MIAPTLGGARGEGQLTGELRRAGLRPSPQGRYRRRRRLDPMPRYLAIHHAPGVTAEDFQKSVPAVLEGKHATFVQSYANMVDGVIVNIYDGASAKAVEQELERIGFPYDEVKEIQFAASFDDLKRMAGQ
jgi:hypothetical protein